MASRKHPQTSLEQAGMEQRPFHSATLKLEEVPGVSKLRLHSLEDRPLPGAHPYELATETGSCSGDDPAILCLAPREWLLVSESIPARRLLQPLEDLVDSAHSSTLDTSDGLALFRLTGPGAPWLLSKLSCLDFLAGRKQGRHCARTKMGHIAVIVHYHQPRGDDFVFDLIFDRSFARYFWLLLTESAGHADELAKTHGDLK